VCFVLLPHVVSAAVPQAVANQIAVEKYNADRVAEQHRDDARDSLIQTVVDKGLLALIVALVGFILSKALDRYQSQLAADSAIENRRFDHLDEIWTLLHQCEHIQQEMDSLVRGGVKWHSSKELLGDYRKDFHAKAKQARQKVNETEHWLGAYVYREFIRYHNTLTTLVEKYGEEDLTTTSRLVVQLQRHKRYIADPRHLSLNRWGFRSR
jgi:hypothetical protein